MASSVLSTVSARAEGVTVPERRGAKFTSRRASRPPLGTPGTFRLDVGVLDTGITDAMFQEMERLIADAKPVSRHLTGLALYLESRGQVQIGLADMVNASMGIVTEGIRFGSFSRVLLVGTNGRLGLGPQKIKASAISALGDSPIRSIKRAERLGFWFASAGSTRTVFDMMGLTA